MDRSLRQKCNRGRKRMMMMNRRLVASLKPNDKGQSVLPSLCIPYIYSIHAHLPLFVLSYISYISFLLSIIIPYTPLSRVWLYRSAREPNRPSVQPPLSYTYKLNIKHYMSTVCILDPRANDATQTAQHPAPTASTWIPFWCARRSFIFRRVVHFCYCLIAFCIRIYIFIA